MPQYRWYLVPDFLPGKSAMVFKIHHSMTDGLGIATFFQGFNGSYDATNLPAMRPLSFCKQIFVYLVSPLLILQTLPSVAMMKRDSNALKKDNEPLSGRKTLGYALDLNFSQVKIYCKENKVTINDYCSSLLSTSLYEYFANEEQKAIQERDEKVDFPHYKKVYKIPQTVNVAVPFSLRQPFKTIKDVKMTNDFGSLLIALQPTKKFSDALPAIQKQFNSLKGSLMPFGVLYSTKISVTLPFLMPKMMLEDLTDKYSLVYSNLNASKSDYFFDEKKLIGNYFVAPGVGKLSTGVSICTIGTRMSLGIFSDEVQMKNP